MLAGPNPARSARCAGPFRMAAGADSLCSRGPQRFPGDSSLTRGPAGRTIIDSHNHGQSAQIEVDEKIAPIK
jgi:hypothetical protein